MDYEDDDDDEEEEEEEKINVPMFWLIKLNGKSGMDLVMDWRTDGQTDGRT